MNNFIYESKTKVIFSRGGAKEYLRYLLEGYGDTVLLAYGDGSVINCCKVVAAQTVLDEDIWELEMDKCGAPTRFLPMGCVVTVSGTGSEMNNGAGLAALHPALYRHIYKEAGHTVEKLYVHDQRSVMMKNWKRIITLIVALAMALALSTPGFAAGAGYSDVSPDAWYAGAVDFVTQHGLMNGVGNGRFDPSGSISQAMLVTTLWRIEGEPVVNYLTQFSDMPGGTWYTVNNGNYSDDPDFRPYLTFYPVPEGTAVKGAVLICPGGAFMFRSDGPEGVSVAQALSQRGYQSFVVDYRLGRTPSRRGRWIWPGLSDLSAPMRTSTALTSRILP